MCGIAGILLKQGGTGIDTGRALVDMLDGCQHRGPDSTGFALYGGASDGHLKLRFHVGSDNEAPAAIARLKQVFQDHGATVVEEGRTGGSYRAVVRFAGDLQAFSYAVEQAATVLSIGERLEIVKDVGTAHDVDGTHGVRVFKGSHGLGHVRLATESDVKPEASHPFWATGFSDVAIVHNGQITNYWKMRRRLERRGFEFATDNDSELIAVYLADKMSQGIALSRALEDSIDDLDGTFSFLVSTGDEIGYAKDRLAAKPMIMFENDELVAIASEEVSLNRLFPGRSLATREPAPGSCGTWRLPQLAS